MISGMYRRNKACPLSAAVNAHVNKLLSELDQQWKDVSKSIDEETNKVKKNQKTLLEQNDKINDIIFSQL
jgi:ElaB/YqjD/DUF883 family membrane-anchored ribosome-binding protein